MSAIKRLAVDPTCCPTCGQALRDDPGFRVHPEAGIVVFGDRAAVLTPREMDIFEALRRRPGHVFTKEALLEQFGLREVDEPEIKIIDVFICKIRAKLGFLGRSITSHHGRGYSFVPPQQKGLHDA